MLQTWLITGASSGFGRGLTEKLLARGDQVAATVRRPEVLADLQAEHGDRLWVAMLEVTDTDAVRATVDRAFWGRDIERAQIYAKDLDRPNA